MTKRTVPSLIFFLVARRTRRHDSAARDEPALSSSIPRIIHQTWKDRDPPPRMAALASTWREHHPGWEHRLWTDEEIRALVASSAPSFLPVYDGYHTHVMRVDAFRYFLMKEIGGIYVDLDFE